MTERLRHAATNAREWLLDAAFPFWLEHGIDHAHGGFVDFVGMDGSAIASSPKRTFVQARQVYAFAMAGRLGWRGDWRRAIDTGLETIDRCCRHPRGGFIHRLDADNAPDERRRDLYDQGFVAFAKAHAGDGLDDGDLVDDARRVFHELDRAWSRPPVGYWEGELHDGPYRRQNPHMHLFEAALAICGTRWSTAGDLERANTISVWVSEHFFDLDRGVLPEVFAGDWRPIVDDDVFVIEPGHHFEWVWLRETPIVGRTPAREDDGLVVAVRPSAWSRSPSQCRRRWARRGRAGEVGTSPSLATDRTTAGVDHTSSSRARLLDGTFEREPARASSLYHLVGAYVELVGFAAQIERSYPRTSRSPLPDRYPSL